MSRNWLTLTYLEEEFQGFQVAPRSSKLFKLQKGSMQLLIQVAQVVQTVTATQKNVQKASGEFTLQQYAL